MSSINIFKAAVVERTCIIIYGNMASGKSTLIEKISKILPQFQVVCIDNNRKALFGKEAGGLARELKAEEETVKQLLHGEYVIYETTGASRLFRSVLPQIEKRYRTFFVHIKASQLECLYRHRHRKDDIMVKPFSKKRIDTSTLIASIEQEMINRFDLQLDSEKMSELQMLEAFKKYFQLQ